LHIYFALLRTQLFDGIPQHGTGHMLLVLIQEIFQGVLVDLADLSQHPPDCFVYQVLIIIQQPLSESYGIRKITTAIEGHGRYDTDASVQQNR
jgi:hypothetical protein